MVGLSQRFEHKNTKLLSCFGASIVLWAQLKLSRYNRLNKRMCLYEKNIIVEFKSMIVAEINIYILIYSNLAVITSFINIYYFLE